MGGFQSLQAGQRVGFVPAQVEALVAVNPYQLTRPPVSLLVVGNPAEVSDWAADGGQDVITGHGVLGGDGGVPVRFARPRRILTWARRGKATPTPPAPAVVAAPAYIPPVVRARRAGVLARRGRATSRWAAVTAPVYVPPTGRARRMAVLGRRGRATRTPPPQAVVAAAPYVPPAVRARRSGLLRRVRRPGFVPVDPGTPPTPVARRPRPGFRARARGTVVPIVPTHVPLVGRRVRIIPLPRRGRSTAVPPEQLVPPGSRPVRRRWSVPIRGSVAAVIPEQVAPVAPPYVPPAVHRTRLAWGRRRGFVAAVTPEQVAPVAPPYVPPAVRARRLGGLLARRARPAAVPIVQPVPPAPRSRISLRAPLRKPRRAGFPPMAQPSVPPAVRVRTKPVGPARRGRVAATPPPVPVVPPPIPPQPVHRRAVALLRKVTRPARVTPVGAPPAPVVTPEKGSWWALWTTTRERVEWAGTDRLAEPGACPNDGEPLREGADGFLFCPFDGWRPGPRIDQYVPLSHDADEITACPECGEPLIQGPDGPECRFDGWPGRHRTPPRRAELGPQVELTTCPNDGEPLRIGFDGQLFCPFDGWPGVVRAPVLREQPLPVEPDPESIDPVEWGRG